MDPQALWIVALSVAAPVAGVVGFAVQLRQVKKARLENEKLQLEIEALKAKAAASQNRIVQVTTAEIEKFSGRDIMFSRRTGRDYEIDYELQQRARMRSIREGLKNGAILIGLLLVTGYFAYDVYRLIAWLSTKL